MNKTYLLKIYLSIISLCLATLSATAQNYSVTTTAQCNNVTAGDEIVNFTGATPTAIGNGTLTVYFRGDFDGQTAGGEYLDIYGEGSSPILGNTTSSTTGISNTQCNVNYDSIVISVPMSDINAWAADGTISFTADGGSGVSPNLCYTPAVAYCVYMKLDYPRASGLNDIGVISIDTPTIFCAGSQNIWVTIQNYGLNQVTSSTVNWTWNGVVQTPVNVTQLLDTAQGTNPNFLQLMLGTKTITDADTLIVWTSDPNGGVDTTNINDTLTRIIAPSLTGTYTIDATAAVSNTNFQSFTALANHLSQYGVCGPVTVNVANGPYNEQVIIPHIIGSSTTNTITFNGNGDTLTFAGTSTAPYTLGLNGADYITFNDLVVHGTNSTYALSAHLWNQADSNTFNNCTFLTNANVTATTAVPFSISGSATSVSTTGPSGNGNTLNGCTVLNGYDGIYLYGNSSAASQGNKVTGSRISDFYRYGIYNYYQSGVLIAHDTIERPTRTTLTTFYGIYMSTSCTGFLIEKNMIRNTHGGDVNNTGSAYGIYGSSAGTSANPNVYVNNVISDFNGSTSGSYYGMYLSGSDQRAFHNTIAFNAGTTTTGTTYGLYASGTSGVSIRNNNISLQQPGTGTKVALYYSGTGKSSDFNNLYVSSAGGTNYIGYYSSAPAYANSLAAWRALGFDSSSTNEDPLFVAPASYDFTPSNGQMNDKGDPSVGITTDILGNTRSLTTPDIGAYEFSVPACSQPVAGTATAPASVCSNAPFSISLSGFSGASGITIQWEESPAGAGTFTPIAGATTSTFSVPGIATAMDYQAVVTCANGGSSDISNTVSVNISPFYICYCSPTNTGTTLHSNGYNYLTNVNITGTTLNYTSPQSVGTNIPGGYNQLWPINGSGTNSANLIQGIQYTVNATAAYTNYPIAAWMDYDGNGTFDTSEFIPLTVASNGLDYSGTFIIPYTSVTGYTGLRFRIGYNPGFTSSQSCYNYSSGYETEDYVVDVTLAPGCSGIPNGGTAYALDSTCPGVPLQLNDTAYSYGQGIAYEWQESPMGAGTWTAITGGTNPNFTITAGITTPTDYRLMITCANGGNVSYSNAFTVEVKDPMQCYCTPSTGGGTTYYISGFSTSGAASDIASTSTSGTATGYKDLTGQPPLIAVPGTTFNFSMSVAGGSTYGAAIWIDTSMDGTFQPNEQFLSTSSYLTPPITGSITLPSSARSGTTRMRVLAAFTPSNPSNPCLNTGSGEYQDFTFIIGPPPSCLPVSGVTAVTTLTSATVSWNQSASSPSLGYYWILVPQGSSTSATPIASGNEAAGDTIANIGGLSNTTPFTFYVRAVCSSTDSSFWISKDFATPPVNDSCNNAINIGGGQPTAGTTAGATESIPSGSCAASTTYANDVWYYFSVGSTPGTITVTATNTVGDVVLEVLSGICGSMTEISCADVPAIGTETITMTNPTAGIYYVRVYGYLSSQNPFIVQVTGTPLAIKLLEVTADNYGNRNRINWTSAEEKPGDRYELERSTDGNNFSKVANIAANGKASRYTYWDETPVSGTNYYRLKLVDAAGRFEYSKVVTAIVKGSGFALEAFPNPVSDRLTIKAHGADGEAMVSITDATGKLVKLVTLDNGVAIVDMKGLAQGMYLVKYTDKSHSQVIKVNKQ